MIGKEEIIRHWQIQEHLLQGYRLMFLISQTLLISAGAFVVVMFKSAEDAFVFGGILTFSLLLLRFWQRIATARALDVSFLQGMLYHYPQFENKENLMQEFKNWQKLSSPEKLRRISDLSIEPSQTRKLMERTVPMLYFALWVIFALVMVYKLISAL